MISASDKLAMKESRLALLRARGKDNAGVCRKLEREIRHLKAELNK